MISLPNIFSLLLYDKEKPLVLPFLKAWPLEWVAVFHHFCQQQQKKQSINKIVADYFFLDQLIVSAM